MKNEDVAPIVYEYFGKLRESCGRPSMAYYALQELFEPGINKRIIIDSLIAADEDVENYIANKIKIL